MSARTQWLIVLGLSLGPAVSNGFARFAYGLILPAMRGDLGWSYAEAGWINTANAIGYLAGALLALALIGRIGARALFIGGMALTVIPLILSALTRDFWWLSAWRALAGIGGAPVFIAGGALASALFAGDKSRNALAIAVYFGGGGLGMLLSGLALPWMVEWHGIAVWPLAWLLIGGLGAACHLPAVLAAAAAPAARRPPKGAPKARLPVAAMAPAMAAYFMFGLGYIVYVTFLVAWMRGEGASTALVAGTWALMGIAVMASPLIWSRVLAGAEGGRAIFLTLLATGVGCGLPLVWPGVWGVLASAALFGAAFFMVPTAMTAFGRRNLPEAQWGASLSLLTVVFSVGQIVGPTGAGLVADIAGEVGTGMAIAAGILVVGAVVGGAQRPLGR